MHWKYDQMNQDFFLFIAITGSSTLIPKYIVDRADTKIR